MKASDVIEFFGGGAEAARKLNLSRAAPSNWKRRGNIVPELHARRIHDLTRGRLKFDPQAYQ